MSYAYENIPKARCIKNACPFKYAFEPLQFHWKLNHTQGLEQLQATLRISINYLFQKFLTRSARRFRKKLSRRPL